MESVRGAGVALPCILCPPEKQTKPVSPLTLQCCASTAANKSGATGKGAKRVAGAAPTGAQGAGAATHGGRFNPKGIPALYLALDVLSAIREAQQGLPRKIDPLVLCSYEIDCEDVVDLTNPNVRLGLSISPADLSGGWLLSAQSGETPSSWEVAKRLIASDVAGVIDQYTKFVKPAFNQYVAPSRKFADIIVPWQRCDEA